MAGLTSSSLLKPPLSCSMLSHSAHPPSLSFSESNLFGLHLSFPALSAAPSSKSDPFIHLSSSSSSSLRPVSARYGGRSDDDDQALDFSSIRSDNVRLIDEQQNMVGVVSKKLALQMADDAELDLVVLSPDADPPVVRIMDYDKFRYEQQKKKREQQKKSAASRMDMKELKMGYNIDVHDYTVRLKAAKKFLQEGDKVKVFVNLKGRENEFRSIAIDLIKRFQNDVGELGIEESKNFKERNIYMVLVPNKALLQKGQESSKSKEKSTVQSAGILS